MELAIQHSLTYKITTKVAILYNTVIESIEKISGLETCHYERRTFYQVLQDRESIDYLDIGNLSVSTVIHAIETNRVEDLVIKDPYCFMGGAFEKLLRIPCIKENDGGAFFIKLRSEVRRLHEFTKSYNLLSKRINLDTNLIVVTNEKCLPTKDVKIIEIHYKSIKKIQKYLKKTANLRLIYPNIYFGNRLLQRGELMFYDSDDASYKQFNSDATLVLFDHYCFSDFSQDAIDSESQPTLALFQQKYPKKNPLDFDFLKYVKKLLMIWPTMLDMVIFTLEETMADSTRVTKDIKNIRKRILVNTQFFLLNNAIMDLL